MSVARNWVQLGHYGRLLDGKHVPRGMEAAFPVTGSIAFSFFLFGVGIYQARIVSVIFTLGALLLLYELTSRFYDRSIGIATLIVLVLLTGNVEVNPLIVGRQVLAETPALFFLLAGCFCFILIESRSIVYLLGVIIFWSLALASKMQVKPFWAVALLFAIALSLIQRKRRVSACLFVAFVGSILLLFSLQSLFVQSAPASDIFGLTQVIALALNRHSRVAVLGETLEFGIPTMLGLGWGLWRFFREECKLESHTNAIKVFVLVLAASWFAWYELLSIGWPRYLFPAAFLASPFLAAMLRDWTNNFSLTYTIERSASLMRMLRISQGRLAALTAMLLIAMFFGRTLTVLYGAYVVDADNSVETVAHFLNNETPPSSLIETYETELFVFLKRRYHYPPDQTHVDLIRKNSFGERVVTNYDPLAADPDYLVTGRQNRFWDFYDPYVMGGAFRRIKKIGEYEIFERVR